MSDFSEAFNALPYAERVMLGAMLTEAEIRIIEAEKKRLRSEFDKTIAAHNARIKAMREHLDRIGKVAQPQSAVMVPRELALGLIALADMNIGFTAVPIEKLRAMMGGEA